MALAGTVSPKLALPEVRLADPPTPKVTRVVLFWVMLAEPLHPVVEKVPSLPVAVLFEASLDITR